MAEADRIDQLEAELSDARDQVIRLQQVLGAFANNDNWCHSGIGLASDRRWFTGTAPAALATAALQGNWELVDMALRSDGLDPITAYINQFNGEAHDLMESLREWPTLPTLTFIHWSEIADKYGLSSDWVTGQLEIWGAHA